MWYVRTLYAINLYVWLSLIVRVLEEVHRDLKAGHSATAKKLSKVDFLKQKTAHYLKLASSIQVCLCHYWVLGTKSIDTGFGLHVDFFIPEVGVGTNGIQAGVESCRLEGSFKGKELFVQGWGQVQ